MSFEYNLQPGAQIVTCMGNYEHQSVVSDRRCPMGKPMLISATARTGTVREEPYDIVVKGRRTGYALRQSVLPVDVVLANARSEIGKWRYDAVLRNCEGFANWAGGLEMSSRQVKGTVAGAAIFAVATKMISENPSLGKYALWMAIGGSIGLAGTQVLKNRT